MTGFGRAYWQESSPDATVPSTVGDEAQSLSSSFVENLIIGAGYTGLSAAIELAQAQQPVAVVDQGALWGEIGPGCSSRNGGQVGFSLKPSLQQLTQWYGHAIADALIKEALAANDYLETHYASEAIGWQKNGTFVGAHTNAHARAHIRSAQEFSDRYEQPIKIIRATEVAEEIQSPLYRGGVVYCNEASVQPRLLHVRLLNKARSHGALIYERHRVESVTRVAGGWFEVGLITPQGAVRVRAKRVLIATNGTTTAALGPVHRWLFPVGSYQLATAELDERRARELIKHHRNVSDVRRVITYARLSPDGRRLLFGGRSAAIETSPSAALQPLRRQMLEVFPSLQKVAIDHVWLGHVGFTFREHPLVGNLEDYYYALGYCGQGVPLAIYYGHRIGQVMANAADPPVMWNLGAQSRFYYRKKAWFLPLAIKAYQWADRLGV